jgi:uncharacterized protein YggE
MHALLSLAVSLASAQAVTIDGNVLTVTSSAQHLTPTDQDVLTIQLSASDQREWDGAIATVGNAEERIRALVKKEEPAAVFKVLSHHSTLITGSGSATSAGYGGSVTRALEIRLPSSPKTQLLASRIGGTKAVVSLTTTHDVSDRKKALSDARRAAVEAVRAKAEDYALATGRKVGKLTSLVEAAEVAQPPHAATQLAISSTLTVKYALE